MNLLRRAVVVLVTSLLILLSLPLDSARPAEEKATENVDNPLDLAIDPRASLQLQAATAYMKEEDWKNTVRLLQHLLDGQPDAMARLAGRDGKVERYVGVHAEAERLLAMMPEAGRAVYQRTFGPRAAELLEQARKDRDAELFAAIVRRYLYTEAGPSALQGLARQHYRAGRLHFAAYSYAKLIEHLGLARWTNDDLYQATAAFHQRSTSAYADRTLKQLLARSRQNIVSVGERRLTVEQLRTELQRATPPGRTLEWPIFGGSVTRSAQGAGSPPFLEAIWRYAMLYSEDFERPDDLVTLQRSPAYHRLRQAEKRLQEHHRPILPAFAPITVTLTRGGKKIPQLIYRNYWGIVARELKTGEMVWATPSNWSLQRLISSRGDSAKVRTLSDWLDFYIEQGNYPQIPFDNSTIGTLSSDGKFVYTVEDFAVPPPVEANNRYPADIQDAIGHNRLQAYSLAANGKLTWELGGDDKGPLAECYFLAPPLPLDGLLYLLVEKKQELYLLRLESSDTHNPKIVSLQPLVRIHTPLAKDPYRRIRAAHLAYADGILVCPTNEGMVLGIDLLSGGLAWVYPYRWRGEALPLPQDAAEKPDAAERQEAAKEQDAAERPVLRWDRIVVAWDRSRNWKGLRMKGPKSLPASLADNGPTSDQRRVESARPQVREPRAIPPEGRRSPDGQFVREHPQPYWAASAPVISDGKVVFTPPDAPSIHCLNLKDGSLVWSHEKKADELYLGGVYRSKVLIVGTNSVRGISLDSGATLWTVETGTPSGRGIAAGDVYYLPLKEATRSKRPELLAIDVDKGQVVRHIRSRPRTPGGDDFETPGNLLFFEGDVISLTPWEIAAYPQRKVKTDRINERLRRNLDDPAALTERAALRLDDGELTAAIEDLRNALKNKPDAKTRHRASSFLFETLTELFQRDLRDAEKYLKEYEELGKMDLEGAGEAEQDRRRVSYFLLVARLRASQGRPKEALQAYLDLAALGPGEEMVSPPGEPALRVRRDVWIRGRITELLKRATPEQRKQLQDETIRRWKEVRGREKVRGLRDFMVLFGLDTAGGREAALQLAERLLRQRDYLEAELLLQDVRRRREDSIHSARAVEMLGRLMTAQGLLPEAVYYYRILRRDFGTIQLPDGKTGAEVLDTLGADKRFLLYLDEIDPFSFGKFRARKEAGDFPLTNPVFRFEHEGEALPFFRRHFVGLNANSDNFQLVNRATGKELWQTRLASSNFHLLRRQLFYPPKTSLDSLRFWHHTVGSLIVLPLGSMIFVIDPVHRRVLWQKDLAAADNRAASPEPPNQHHDLWKKAYVDGRDGGVRLIYPDNWVQYVGRNLLLSPSMLCLPTRTGLQAFEPRTGRLLWTRSDLTKNVRIFGDEEYVCLGAENADGEAVSTRVLRLADGGTVRAADFADLFANREQVFGRTLLIADRDAKGSVILRQYDIPTGADVWKAKYRPKSIVLHSEDPSLAGVVEPDGKVHVVDLRTRKEVMTGQMDKENVTEHLRNVQSIHLLADRKYFYLACQAEVDINKPNRREDADTEANVMTQLGMRSVPVNGYLYVFEYGGSDACWFISAKNQFLVLNQFSDLPVVFLTARSHELRERVPKVSVVIVEKRSGRIIFDPNNLKMNKPFYAVRFHPQSGTIDFLSPTLKITAQSADTGK